MAPCQQNETSLSLEALRAFARGESHGDEAGELAAHIEQCAGCSGQVSMLKVVGWCDRVLGLEPPLEPTAVEPGKTAQWRRIADGLFQLPQPLRVSLKRLRELIVTWADQGGLAVSTPTLQLLIGGEGTQVERRVAIASGAGSLSCALSLFRDAQGDTRIAVGFPERQIRECGVLRIRLSRAGQFIESQPVDGSQVLADLLWVSFDTVLSAGEYTVELRGRTETYRVELKVD
jgi:hypothetical protein